jgi:plasminogen
MVRSLMLARRRIFAIGLIPALRRPKSLRSGRQVLPLIVVSLFSYFICFGFSTACAESTMSSQKIGQVRPLLDQLSELKRRLSGMVHIEIIGGAPAPVEDNPWQVLLLLNGGRQFCGGSVIGPYWILTAAHCSIGANNDPSNILVVYGTSTFSSGGQRDTVKQLYLHPDLKSIDTLGDYDNDFALLRLNDKLGEIAKPIALPEPGTTVGEGDMVTVTGWGSVNTKGVGHSQILLGVTLPVVSNATCQSSFAKQPDYANIQITKSMLCAGPSEGGMDSCSGDSGGPLSISVSGVRTLEGVVSWGPDLCAQPDQYGVYARVSEALSWIRDTINRD